MDFDDYDSYAPIAPVVPPTRRSPLAAKVAACTLVVALAGIAAAALR